MNLAKFLGWTLVAGLALSGQAFAQPDLLWSRTFGGEGQDSLGSLIMTSDRGFVAVGTTSNGRNADAYAVKVNAQGALVWQDSYGDTALREECHDVVELASGGFALCGIQYTGRNNVRKIAVNLIRDTGEGMAQVLYGGDGGYDDAYSIIEKAEFELALGGVTYPGNDWHDDFAIRTINPVGEETGFQRYGLDSLTEIGLDLIKTDDGGCALAGQSLLFDDAYEIVDGQMSLVKTDGALSLLWRKDYRVANSVTFGNSVIQTPDGGFLLCGAVGELDPPFGVAGWDVWLIRLNSSGEREWAQAYDFGRDEWGMQVIPVNEGFVIVGITGSANGGWELFNNDCFLLRVNLEGERQWYREFGGREDDTGLQVIATSDGGYLIGGNTASTGAGATDFWLLKTSRDPLLAPSDPPVNSSFFILHSAFPNPFNSSTTISYDLARPGFVRLGVYDTGGRLVGTVREGYAMAGKYQAVWNGGGAGSGTYFLNLEGDGTKLTKPIVLIR